jgi:ABC-type Fe3+/spermidine/putrescine transport system ATPase subunit
MSTGHQEKAVVIDAATHRYGSIFALRDVSLALEAGEFLTLLGPSGCGKTTLLRIMAGFVHPTAGRILLDGRDVTDTPPHRRPINTVFQRPALFPHLDVGDNVAFSLRLSRVPKHEIARRVTEALTLVRLEGFERRRSHELSGGQMQRVALARVLVARPKVLLLDEPLSALDLAIRLEMEAELRRVHREIGATFVYVTHDQREALALSDRIVVLKQGRIEQVGKPEEIYRQPASPFAARFVGDANTLPVEIVATSGRQMTIGIGSSQVVVDHGDRIECRDAWLVLRPEVIRVSDSMPTNGGGLPGVVHDFAYRGAGYAYRIAVPGVRDLLKVEVAAEGARPFTVGSRVTVAWDASSCALLPRAKEAAL